MEILDLLSKSVVEAQRHFRIFASLRNAGSPSFGGLSFNRNREFREYGFDLQPYIEAPAFGSGQL
jgi:hypothetical protein